MPKATTKIELLRSANDKFNKLQAIIDSLSISEQQQNFTYNADELTLKDNALHWKRDKNLRDVLAHLFEWHQLVLNWVLSNQDGIAASFLPTPYTWTTYQQMNVAFNKKHKDTPYKASRQMLDDSHKRVTALIEKYTDAELFEKKHFSWTGTTSLGQYFHSATVAHYDWAIKKLNTYIKALAKH